MKNPTIFLGVEMMDRDHLRIEQIFAAAAGARDDALPALYAEAMRELAEHFAREEDFMREIDFPGLHCHVAQHAVLIGEMKRAGAVLSGDPARRRIGTIVPALVLSHVATMDRMVAAFLRGELATADFDGLRLPTPATAA